MPDQKWEIDLNQIKAKDIDNFQLAFDAVQQKNDFAGFFPWTAKIIKRWPFDLAPDKVEDYWELGLLDLRRMIAQVADAFQSLAKITAETSDSGLAGDAQRTAGTPEGT